MRHVLIARHLGVLLIGAAVLGWAGEGGGKARAQESELRGTLDQADARFDAGDPEDDAADEDETGARLLPEDLEEQLAGADEPEEPARRVRAANGRLVPASAGQDRDARATSRERAVRLRPLPTVGTPLPDGSTIPRANVAAQTVQGGGVAGPQPGPFDPLGTRLGPLRVVTQVEQALGATSNADFASGGESATFSETRFDLTATSDLPVHELRGSLRGSYRKFLSGDADDLPTVDAEGAFRYDVTRDTSVTFGATWSVATESATDDSLLGLAQPIDARPLVQRGEASIEAARTGGRIFGSLRGSIGREVYGDIEFADGTSRSQADREATLFETAIRVGYAHTPALRPFVEGEIGYRLYDERNDFSGQNRNAARYALRAGVLVDLAERLSGEVALGVEAVDYESRNLDSFAAPSVSARLDWTPDRLTRIALTAQTVFDDSATAGVGGTLDTRIAATATRDLRDNLDLFGTLSLNLSDPGGSREETTVAAELGLAWSINRALAITGRVGYSRVESALANADYDVRTASIGLRWQR